MAGDNGFAHILTFDRPPERVVSLVPSMTQSMIDLHAGSRLVGVTDFCPADKSAQGEPLRIGGPRDPDVAAIINLKPGLVLANKEENNREAVEALEANEIRVWVTFPKTVSDALQILWAMVKVFRLEEQALQLLSALERSLEWVASAAENSEPTRVFCPIWQDELEDGTLWWMTCHGDTYLSDVLRVCGGANIFADRERRYPLRADLGLAKPEPPGERDVRYPRVAVQAVSELDPEVILLPSEPFAFNQAHRERVGALLQDTAASRKDRIHLVDGRLLTWHGTYLARALSVLPDLLFVR